MCGRGEREGGVSHGGLLLSQPLSIKALNEYNEDMVFPCVAVVPLNCTFFLMF